MPAIKNILAAQRTYFTSGITRDLSFRIDALNKLKQLLKNHEEEIFQALQLDFRKPPFETYATELGVLYTEIDHIVSNLKKWAKPKRVRGSLVNFPSRNYIHSQPYGIALVIGAWNYPIQLALNPALGSIAAGNCTIIKPSELVAHSSAILAKIINTAFTPGFLKVVEGDAAVTQTLLEQPLDYIFFTGSTKVGKIIMKAAARQLTPVTLELGGKSPCIIDETADLAVAARRIAWGKFVNAGQTCVAPDYLYLHSSIKDSFMDHLTREITNFYGPDPQKSADYPRIIDQEHYDRLKQYLDEGTLVSGGRVDEDQWYIEPTVLTDITWDMPIMQEEIFGPILPVLMFKNIEDIVSIINNKPSPLALYLFSKDKKVQRQVIRQTRFGGGCINDTIAYFGNYNLPFGGIGQSGLGNYHGKKSFDTFSHKKSIMHKPIWIDIPLRYAPYEDNFKWLKKIMT